jgi:transposase, IS30 family
VVSEELRAGFFEALDRENGSISGAARVVGVNRATASGWARKVGVRGRGKTGTAGHPGRAEYDRLRASGVRRRDAAAQVGVHERTARDWDRGIRKIGDARLHSDGRRIDYKTSVGVYQPHRAQRAWAKSRPRPEESKLAQDGLLRGYVADKLRERWSPEQICHALVTEFPDDEGMRVSPETIYQAIYVQARGGLRTPAERLRDLLTTT